MVRVQVVADGRVIHPTTTTTVTGSVTSGVGTDVTTTVRGGISGGTGRGGVERWRGASVKQVLYALSFHAALTQLHYKQHMRRKK